MPQKKLNIKPETWVLLVGFVALVAVWACYLCMPTEASADPQDDLFAVHGLKIDDLQDREEINFYVKIPNSIPLINRVQVLADKISQFKFTRRPIIIKVIGIRKGKKIAVIDLHDKTEVGSTAEGSWYSAFQGTWGGMSTWTTLTKSFLQKDYQGEWIDGVEFLYNGKPFFNDQWDHIHLEGTMMRDGSIFLRNERSNTHRLDPPWES